MACITHRDGAVMRRNDYNETRSTRATPSFVGLRRSCIQLINCRERELNPRNCETPISDPMAFIKLSFYPDCKYIIH